MKLLAVNSLVAFLPSYFHLLFDSAGWYQSCWRCSHEDEAKWTVMCPEATMIIQRQVSFYHPTGLSTDQLITWYFFLVFQLEFLLLTWELKRKPLLRQVQAHISFIAGSRLLTEISSSLCCVTAWNERIKSQSRRNFKYCSQMKTFLLCRSQNTGLQKIISLRKMNSLSVSALISFSPNLPFPKTESDLSIVCANNPTRCCQQNVLLLTPLWLIFNYSMLHK